jgi:hypothetical protein
MKEVNDGRIMMEERQRRKDDREGRKIPKEG